MPKYQVVISDFFRTQDN